MDENIADSLMLPAIFSGHKAGKYFQPYAIFVAGLNVPLQKRVTTGLQPCLLRDRE
jgi:hypothetical protein